MKIDEWGICLIIFLALMALYVYSVGQKPDFSTNTTSVKGAGGVISRILCFLGFHKNVSDKSLYENHPAVEKCIKGWMGKEGECDG